jgi:hypothetical protein
VIDVVMLGGPYDGTVYPLENPSMPMIITLPIEITAADEDALVPCPPYLTLYPQRTVHGWRFLWPKGY